MDSAEDVQLDGWEVLKIQNRPQFIQEIRNMLLRHVNGDNVLGNKVLISLIHGMHACIPLGNYGSMSSVVSFLLSFCKDYEFPWPEDEAVLRALMTYALDLLPSPERRKPLVEREIQFDELASELIDGLVNTDDADVVTFGFWLMYRIPYAFKSRETILLDIARVWTSTSKVVPEGHLRQLNFYAVDAFVAIAQSYVVSNGTLPKLAPHTALRLLNTGLERHSSRPMAIYAIAMVLNLGTSTQVTAFTSGIKVESSVEALLNSKRNLEESATEEGTIDLHINSTFILQKLRPIELDIGKVKGLIGAMEKTIGNAAVRTTEADISPDLNQVRWKSTYPRRCFSRLCLNVRGRSASRDYERGYERCWEAEGYRLCLITGSASWCWFCLSDGGRLLTERLSSRDESTNSPCSCCPAVLPRPRHSKTRPFLVSLFRLEMVLSDIGP